MSDSEDDYGPPLPPGFAADSAASSEPATSSEMIGPALPLHLRKEQPPDHDGDSNDVSSTDQPDCGPSNQMYQESDGEESDDFIGPTLPGQSDSSRRYGSGHRADVCDSNDKRQGREEWMTVVPKKVEKKLGLSLKSQTTFSKASAADVRDDDEDARPTTSNQKEENISSALEDYSKKKRSLTLVEMHEEKLKKKRKEDGSEKKTVRRPLDFNPEDDLTMRKFDERQRKSVMDKAKLLNTRFAKGTSKYL